MISRCKTPDGGWTMELDKDMKTVIIGPKKVLEKRGFASSERKGHELCYAASDSPIGPSNSAASSFPTAMSASMAGPKRKPAIPWEITTAAWSKPMASGTSSIIAARTGPTPTVKAWPRKSKSKKTAASSLPFLQRPDHQAM